MIEIVILTGCLLIAIGTICWLFIKSNKVLFYDHCNEKVTCPLVSAGSVYKDKSKANVSLLGAINENTDMYDRMLVDGNSMKEFGIQTGDMVFVDRNFKNEELSAKTNSIIAFTIQPKQGMKIEYKLRKFIDFYDTLNGQNFKQWLAVNHSNLDQKEAWIDKETGKDKREFEVPAGNSRFVLSETRIKKGWWDYKRRPHYSIHSEDRMIGRVQYKIPGESVYILNKE